MEIRHAMWNQRERRLRAALRLLVGLVVFATVLVAASGLRAAVAGLSVAGPLLVATVTVLGYLLYYGLNTATLLALSRWLDGRTLRGLGLGGDGWWANLGFGLLVGVAMTTAVFLVELAAGLVAVDGVLVTRPENQFGVTVSPLAGIPLTFLFFVGVGVFEEVLSRGYLFQNIAEGLDGIGPVGARGATAAATVVTSLLFALLHLANPGTTLLSTLNIAVVGVFLAGTYVVSGDLGIPIGIHITWNFSLSSLYGFPVSGLTTPVTVLSVRQTGPALVTGGRFGPEGGLVFYLALAVGVALTWWWVRRTEGAVRFRTGLTDPDLRNPKRPVRGDD